VIVVCHEKFNPGKRAWFPLLIRALAGADTDKVASWKSQCEGRDMNGIDSSRIDAMVTQLRNAATRATGAIAPPKASDEASPTGRVDFSEALRSSLDQVNGAQKKAESLGERFALGDDSVNLSDVMIATQKASIGFQATVQVRNKLVSAYHDIMNMQV
jgi:flagellar hook-basal body complex protein FliE